MAPAPTFESCARSTWCSVWISRRSRRLVNGDSARARGLVSRCPCRSRSRSRFRFAEKNVSGGWSAPASWLRLRLFFAFLYHPHFERHRHFAVQLQRYGVLADRLDRLGQNELPSIDL